MIFELYDFHKFPKYFSSINFIKFFEFEESNLFKSILNTEKFFIKFFYLIIINFVIILIIYLDFPNIIIFFKSV
jgi:hypothetical protein